MSKLPNSVDINNLLDDLRSCCWEASDILLNYSQKIKNEQYKSNFLKLKKNNEPVTLADLDVNSLIVNHIQDKYSDINWQILSEESIKTELNTYKKTNWLWILDPLDGTKDFVQGTGHFAVHLALNYKNKPFMGIVLIPSKNELWISNGKNVWCENKEGFKKLPDMSNSKELSDMIVITSRNHNNRLLQKIIEKIDFKKSIYMGSIGCKIASILRGEADIYISLSLPGQSAPKDWDFAAPEVIFTQAGGAITNLDNKELVYGKPDMRQEGLIIASNNKINHENICLEIKKIIQDNNFL